MRCPICGEYIGPDKPKNTKYCSLEHRRIGDRQHTKIRDSINKSSEAEKEFEFIYGIKPNPGMLERYKKWKRGLNGLYKDAEKYRPMIEEL